MVKEGYIIYNTKKKLYKYGMHWLKDHAQVYFSKRVVKQDLEILREQGVKYLRLQSIEAKYI